MRSIIVATVLLLGVQSSAFDFGSVMESVAPVATAVAPATDTALVSNPLIKNITTNLGVTPTQAIGGSAAILKDATTNMKPADVKTLTAKMPQVGTLLSAAPTGMLAGSGLPSQFTALGMNPSMIDKFTPFVLDYVKTGTTPGMAQLVQAALLQ